MALQRKLLLFTIDSRTLSPTLDACFQFHGLRMSESDKKTEENTTSDDGFATNNAPRTAQEWKKWKQERKAEKRKWKEDKLVKKLEKQKDRDEEQEKKKLRLEEEQTRINNKGRPYTVSLALPGSILDNAQTPELRTYLAGQIARAVVVFNIDEVIIFDESGAKSQTTDGDFDGVGKKGEANVQMARILQYLECPQYLRKAFFPQHKDLQYAGLLNPLDCPHHMRADDVAEFREGVVLQKPTKPGKGSFVNVGLYHEVQIDKALQPGVRVTVRMDLDTSGKKMQGSVVAPSTPRKEAGLFWGYTVRLASSLSSVFTESPFKGGYDCSIGTSERGASVDDFELQDRFSHLLIVFGGLQGLEASVDADQDLHLDDPSELFSHYLNVCPGQGSRTIRTEEAILIAMSALRPKITSSVQVQR